MPESGLDHKDGVGHHNWIDNLRPATKLLNSQNRRKANKNSKTGVLGVHWHKKLKKWAVCIAVDGQSKHIGYFPTMESANEANIHARRKFLPGNTL